MADHRDTLLLPFEQGVLSPPKQGERWRLLNADVLPPVDIDWSSVLTCQQGFRPTFNALENAGMNVLPVVEENAETAGSLVLCSRSKEVNRLNLIKAWNQTAQGGLIAVAGAKTSGVQPLRKWAAQSTEVEGSLSKNHAVVFWIRREGDDWEVEEKVAEVGGYHVAPGMFSASGPDKGSQLLVEHFDNRIRGNVADFGAGWGYLSAELLKRSDNVESINLYEADHASLEAAKLNVGEKASFHWVDMVHEAPKGPFNWIIMNPPFHTGRAAEPKLGLAFIQAAAKSLPSGGRLLMVANTNLPYEAELQERFKKVELLSQANGFKVIQAVR